MGQGTPMGGAAHLDREGRAQQSTKAVFRSTSSIFGSGVDLRQRQQVLRALRVPELSYGSGAMAPLKDLRGDLPAGGVLHQQPLRHQRDNNLRPAWQDPMLRPAWREDLRPAWRDQRLRPAWRVTRRKELYELILAEEIYKDTDSIQEVH